MDIMDMNKLQVFSDSIEQELTAIEEVIPNDAEYTEMYNYFDKLYDTWMKFDMYLSYIRQEWNMKGD